MSCADSKSDARLQLLTAAVQLREAVYCGQHAAVFEESVHNHLQSMSGLRCAQSENNYKDRDLQDGLNTRLLL